LVAAGCPATIFVVNFSTTRKGYEKNILGHIEHGENRLEESHSRDAKEKAFDDCCHCISVARFLFGSDPARAAGAIEYDPQMKIDRLASGVLEFEKGTATFTCSTQLANHQRVSIFGKLGSLEIANPFTPQSDESRKLVLQTGLEKKEIIVETRDQYTRQGDLFSQAILNDSSVPTPLADGVAKLIKTSVGLNLSVGGKKGFNV
jgi:predicted dehydrogenase